VEIGALLKRSSRRRGRRETASVEQREIVKRRGKQRGANDGWKNF